MEKATYKIKIIGKVQNVGFRYAFQKIAISQDLKGYVKNKSDGSVEALVSGEKDSIFEVISWCQKGGPPDAVVNQVDIEELVSEKVYQKMEINYE